MKFSSLPLSSVLIASALTIGNCTHPTTTSTAFVSPSSYRVHKKNECVVFGASIIRFQARGNNDLHEADIHKPKDEKRRKALFAIPSLPFFGGGKRNRANAEETFVGDVKPIADFPMKKLRLPKGGLGREYIIIQLYIKGKGPFDFMVDSGLTTELITPHLQQVLDLNKSSGVTKQGLSAGSISQTQSLVELDDVSLCCSSGDSDQNQMFPLPSPLNAIVTDFPQEHMDPEHDPVEGMIGMEVLERFDVDLDFPAGRLRLWKPGTVREVAKKEGFANIDAVVVNETRLLGFRVLPSSLTSKTGNFEDGIKGQPFLGVVDCGASFSVVNWAAAPLLGLPPKSDAQAYKTNPMVQGVGVDGRPNLLPTTTISLSYCGDPIANKEGGSAAMSFASPPPEWKPWDPVQLAIGDLPVFTQLLGDGRTPYRGPAGIIGLDILSQRRVILETSAGRRRRIYVGKS
mmetsp:Transcript_31703/g.67186  ORF Transcript_31703/g.67186 Transcript_31703/m.67186 type:complete len:458 (-) Transcript_31703:143-1516(-)